jgi:hypothetical protein
MHRQIQELMCINAWHHTLALEAVCEFLPNRQQSG